MENIKIRYELPNAKDWRQLIMKSDNRKEKIKKLKEQRNKVIKSLTDHKESNLPVSAAAEYLTFVAGNGESSVEVRYQDENI